MPTIEFESNYEERKNVSYHPESARTYPNENAIFLNVRNAETGAPFGLNVALFVLNNPSINEVWFLSMTGAGKSILNNQFSYTLNLYDQTIVTKKVMFDRNRDRILKKYGNSDTADWPFSRWLEVQTGIQNELNQVTSNDGRAIKTVEVIYPDKIGRCQYIVEEAMSNRFDKAGKLTKLFLLVAPDPRIIEIAKFVRNLVESEPPTGLKTKLLTHNIDLGPYFNDSENSGLIIKHLYHQMGQAHHFIKLYAELDALVDEWKSNGWKDPKTNLPVYFEDFFKRIQIPLHETSLRGLEQLYAIEAMRSELREGQLESDIYIWKKRIAYMMLQLHRFEIESLETGGSVLLNPISRKKIFNDLSASLYKD